MKNEEVCVLLPTMENYQEFQPYSLSKPKEHRAPSMENSRRMNIVPFFFIDVDMF